MLDLLRFSVIVAYNTNHELRNMKSRLAFPAISLGLCIALSACSGSTASTEAPAKAAKTEEGVPVETARVAQGEMTAHYAATAALQAEREAKLVSEVAGTVLELLVEEGDRVQQGQVLARVDAAHSRLQLREAEADLQRRRNEVDRGDKLLERRLIPATTQDQAQSDYAVRRAEVALARVSVAKAEIRAPFAGVVTRRWIKQGQLLAANAPVFDMADFSELRAELRVPERDASALASGQPVSFTVDALSGSRFDARITRVAPIVDGDSGTVKVTIGIDNRDGTLRPGLFARMDIAFKHIADAVLLPKAALFGKSDAAVVFQVKDGKAVRTPIRTGFSDGTSIQILDGVVAGDEVVTMGQAGLSDGALVQVLESDDAARTAQTRMAAAGGGEGGT